MPASTPTTYWKLATYVTLSTRSPSPNSATMCSVTYVKVRRQLQYSSFFGALAGHGDTSQCVLIAVWFMRTAWAVGASLALWVYLLYVHCHVNTCCCIYRMICWRLILTTQAIWLKFYLNLSVCYYISLGGHVVSYFYNCICIMNYTCTCINLASWVFKQPVLCLTLYVGDWSGWWLLGAVKQHCMFCFSPTA